MRCSSRFDSASEREKSSLLLVLVVVLVVVVELLNGVPVGSRGESVAKELPMLVTTEFEGDRGMERGAREELRLDSDRNGPRDGEIKDEEEGALNVE